MRQTGEKSRNQNAKINVTAGTLAQMLNLFLAFVGRSVFINLLNKDYLGVNGLFSNVLSVLSFAELGIGSAIIYSLYKPVAEDDRPRIRALVALYKKLYRLVGGVVFLLGLALVPFLGAIIKTNVEIDENLIAIFLLFVLNSSLSYTLSHRKAVLIACQKEYVIHVQTRIFQIAQIVLQTILLFFTRQYLVYLLAQIVVTVSLNVAISITAGRMYPYLNERADYALSKPEKKSIFQNVKALFLYKFASVVLNGTDDIIITYLFSVSLVGVSSNYVLLTKGTVSIVEHGIGSLTASIGNLVVKGTKERIEEVMRQLLLLCAWVFGFVVIGFMVLSNDFVFLWLGEKYLLDVGVVAAMAFSVFICGMQYPAYSLRITQGLFVKVKWAPVMAAVINIVLSLWLGRLIGLAGVFFATGLSRLLTTTVADPWIVYSSSFEKKPYGYYARYLLYTAVALANAWIQVELVGRIAVDGWSTFIVKAIVLFLSANAVFLLAYFRNPDFRMLAKQILARTGARPVLAADASRPGGKED